MYQPSKNVVLIHSKEYEEQCCLSPKFQNRYKMLIELISSYGLLNRLSILDIPSNIDPMKLTTFHSSDYLEALVRLNTITQNEEDSDEEIENYGFAYDCPGFLGVLSYSVATVSATLAAATQLVNGEAMSAINWGGGWHHAKRSEASGFCYLNDIVYGILKLRETFPRVLYVDLDLHHGDGVEQAFSCTNSVMTFSLHHLSEGFFPGSGKISDLGFGRGKYYSINLPFDEGMNDSAYISVIRQVVPKLFDSFQPCALVLQCGADALASDPHHCFNLTFSAYLFAVAQFLSLKLPTLVLGGGGYNFPDTCKLWTAITALLLADSSAIDSICNMPLPDPNTINDQLLQVLDLKSDIPEHCFWSEYGPDFDMSVTSSMRPNKNSSSYIEKVINQTFLNLKNLKK